jgi:hypothetical protein
MAKTQSTNKFDVGFDIQSDDELSSLMCKLSQDLSDSYVYHNIKDGLQQSIMSHDRVFGQSTTYWYFSIRAFQTGSMLSLCRVFDQSFRNLSLHNYLCVIAKNIEYLSDDRFRKRNSKNRFVENLLLRRSIPNLSEVMADIESVSDNNPLVKKLTIWRNNIVAHTGGNSLLKYFKILDDNSISNEEFLNLIDLGYAKLNKYSLLLDGSEYSRTVFQQEDYKNLLRNAKESIDLIAKSHEKLMLEQMYLLSNSAYEI